MKRALPFLCALFLLLSGCAEPAKSPEEIIAPAMEAYGWFVTGGLRCQPEEVWVEGDDSPWRLVEDSRFPDYDSFYQYLTGIFSQEMVDNTLLAGGSYRELDGKLYTRGGFREKNRFIGGAEYTMAAETSTRREILATAYFVKGAQEYTFVQEKVDGNWVFTQFPYFY